jgi:hypothetical protein
VLLEVPQAPPPKPKTQWYGWQTMIGLGVGNGILLFGANWSNGVLPVMLTGAATHVLTAPIVHFARGHHAKGALSLGLNLGLPALMGGIGLYANNVARESDKNSIDPYFTHYAYDVTLAVSGYILAPIIDIAFLSTEPVPKATPDKPKGAQLVLPSSIGFMPMLDQQRKGLSIVGQF